MKVHMEGEGKNINITTKFLASEYQSQFNSDRLKG